MRYQTTGRNPGPPSPRTKPAEVRLDELMAAAEKLFLAKGVEATTISEIVEEAQVAKGTFYHYFASKNEMLTALGNRYTARFLERLRNAVDGCPPATGGAAANLDPRQRRSLRRDLSHARHRLRQPSPPRSFQPGQERDS